MTVALSEELRRAFSSRVAALESHLEDLVGALAGSRQGFVRALKLIQRFPEAARAVLEAEWTINLDATSRVELTRQYLQHVNYVSALVEDWFARGVETTIPTSLAKAVEREAAELFGPRAAVLAVGSADNFETFVADLKDELFGPLGPRCPSLPAEFDAYKFAMMRIPRFEGTMALWRPIVVGHELAHIAAAEKAALQDLDLPSKFDWATADGLSVPRFAGQLASTPALAVYRAAELWAEELLCDAYAVRRFGAAGVAAMGSFLEVVGATGDASDHPPGWTRVRLQLGWLGPISDSDLEGVLRPWLELAATPRPAIAEDWAQFLMDWFEAIADVFTDVLTSWPAIYDSDTRRESIGFVSGRLQEGVPASEIRRGDGTLEPLEDADILNAGWIGWVQSYDVPVQRLIAKALDAREFLRQWQESGGDFASIDPTDASREPTGAATLSQRETSRRLQSSEADRIVVTPLLPGWSAGAAVDVRLGNRFIVFQRTRTGSFDPLRFEHDPRAMQALVEREWGDPFVLHPDELVLASTLEYLVLPADVAGQVVTRSSYGRLGLMTATAVLAHPHFHGCLTLELVNLGVVPIELTPGERIAQIILSRVEPPADVPDQKYTFPTGPEFSKVRTDLDAQVLRRMREVRNTT